MVLEHHRGRPQKLELLKANVENHLPSDIGAVYPFMVAYRARKGKAIMENNILRVALYPRVSTEEQAMHGYSLEAQVEALQQYSVDHHYKIVGIYRDEGHSARKSAMQRPVMQELLRDVEAGKIDRILFIKLDRWFRNVREYHKVQAILEAHDVTWQAIMEDYSTATADGRLKVNIMLSVAENESDRTSERIQFVFDAKRRRKEWCFTGGLNQWPYGYMPQVDENGIKRCVKNPDLEPIVSDFWDYATKYDSVRLAGMYVCEKYGIIRNYRTWMVTARCELYTGTWHGVEDYCPAYVSHEAWDRLINGHVVIKKTQRPDRVYLFTGLIRCPCCGNTLKSTFKTYPSDRMKEYYSYRCTNSNLKTCAYHHCLSERKIEKYLLENIRKVLEDYVLDVDVEEKKKQRSQNIQDLVTLNEQLRRLNVIFMSGNISDEEYALETNRIKLEIDRAKQAASEDSPVDVGALKAFLQTDFLANYKSLSKEDQRRFWRSIIKEIHVSPDSVDIVDIVPRF